MTHDTGEAYFADEVLSASIPVLVHFWAPWCGVCRMIEPLLYQFQLESGANLKVIQVNADSSLHLANTYRLKSLPTLILFENGSPTYRLDHVASRDQLRHALKSLERDLSQTAAYS
ncbi:MAG: thioredoxin family protein [Cyanobacteria bacterium P01_H01_bin.130]